ncbi:MAG: PIN domain-containing protein [Pseudomonadota bacterium]
MKQVFVDTSGFYAMLDGTDPFHPKALDCFNRAVEASWQLVTTNYVMHETWALIQARLGWEAVDAWIDRVAPLCDVVWVDAALHGLGEARCRQARERRLSLTDCITIETMHRRRITDVIADDEHLSREGFKLP